MQDDVGPEELSFVVVFLTLVNSFPIPNLLQERY